MPPKKGKNPLSSLSKIVDAKILKDHLECTKTVALKFAASKSKLRDFFQEKDQEIEDVITRWNKEIDAFLAENVSTSMAEKSNKMGEEHKKELAKKKEAKKAAKEQQDQPGQPQPQPQTQQSESHSKETDQGGSTEIKADPSPSSSLPQDDIQQMKAWLIKATRKGELVVASEDNETGATSKVIIKEISADSNGDKLVIKTSASSSSS